MPPKMTTCSICNQEVMKSQTAALGDGTRACKSHDGVLETQEELKGLAGARRRKLLKKPVKRSRYPKTTMTDPNGGFDKRCFICNKLGIHESDHAGRMLMAMAKYKEKTGKNFNILLPKPDDMKIFRECMRSPNAIDDRELTPLHIYPAEDNKHVIKHLNEIARMGLGIIPYIAACPECVKSYKLTREEAKPTLEQMHMLGTVVNCMEGDMAELARGELAANSPDLNRI